MYRTYLRDDKTPGDWTKKFYTESFDRSREFANKRIEANRNAALAKAAERKAKKAYDNSLMGRTEATAKNVSKKVSKTADKVSDKVREAAKNSLDFADEILDKASDKAKDVAKNISESEAAKRVNVAANRTKYALEDPYVKTVDKVKDVAENVSDAVKDTAKNVRTKAENTVKNTKTAVKSVANRTVYELEDTYYETIDKASSWVDGLFGKKKKKR